MEKSYIWHLEIRAWMQFEESHSVVSLIAPIYGVERFMRRFAESVLGQSYPYIQFIFVNDGTKDSSMEILDSVIRESYSHLRERIVIVNKENEGLPAARRTGMEYANGDYVWHIDSDDWIETDAVAKIVDCVRESDADVVYFNFYRELGEKTELVVENDYDCSRKALYQTDMFNHKAYGCVWNKCVKRRLYEDNPVHFARYPHAEDTILMSQLIGYAGSIVHLNDALYHYRKDNPDALTRENSRKRRRELLLNYMSLYEIYREASSSPVSPIMDHLFYRAGRYSLIYRLGLFERYPYLADKILESEIQWHSATSVPAQIILKAYACIRRKIRI